MWTTFDSKKNMWLPSGNVFRPLLTDGSSDPPVSKSFDTTALQDSLKGIDIANPSNGTLLSAADIDAVQKELESKHGPGFFEKLLQSKTAMTKSATSTGNYDGATSIFNSGREFKNTEKETEEEYKGIQFKNISTPITSASTFGGCSSAASSFIFGLPSASSTPNHRSPLNSAAFGASLASSTNYHTSPSDVPSPFSLSTPKTSPQNVSATASSVPFGSPFASPTPNPLSRMNSTIFDSPFTSQTPNQTSPNSNQTSPFTFGSPFASPNSNQTSPFTFSSSKPNQTSPFIFASPTPNQTAPFTFSSPFTSPTPNQTSTFNIPVFSSPFASPTPNQTCPLNSPFGSTLPSPTPIFCTLSTSSGPFWFWGFTGPLQASPSSYPFASTTSSSTPSFADPSIPYFGSFSGFAGFGTKPVPYTPTTDTDRYSKIQSISCMLAYEGKSHEELRWEDYQ